MAHPPLQMSNANAFIYLLTDPRNNEAVYIGKTTEPTTRLRNHIKRPCSGQMTRFIASLPSGVFPKMEVIESCDHVNWEQREKFWIRKFRELGANLLNVSSGGNGFSEITESTRAALSKAALGRKPSAEAIEKSRLANTGRKRSKEFCQQMSLRNAGRVHSQETRAKMSESRKGRQMSAESIEKTRAANIGRKLSPEHIAKMRGRVCSAQTRQKISSAKRGRKLPIETIEKMRAAHAGRRPSQLAMDRSRAANKGRKCSPESIARMRAAQSGYVPSPETLRKLHAANIGRKRSVEELRKGWETRRANKALQEKTTNNQS
jgi:hypothetical protein